MSSWYEVDSLTLNLRRVRFHRVSFDLDPDSPATGLSSAAERALGERSVDTKVLINKNDGQLVPISAMWSDLDQSEVYVGLEPGAPPRRVPLKLRYGSSNQRYQIETDAGLADIVEARIFCELWIEPMQVPVSQVSRLTALRDGPTTDLIEYQFEVDGRPMTLMIARESGIRHNT